MQLRDGGRIVGALLAVYSDQTIDGRAEKFCNPHSWCVLDEYRNQGIGLVLAAIKQRGYHYTMMTPNPKVAEIFRGLRFKDLDKRISVFPNVPSLSFGATRETRTDHIAQLLRGETLRDFELHREIPWLSFVAFGKGADICLVAYKRRRWKRTATAWILYVSDAGAFERHQGVLRQALLGKGFVFSQMESRFLPKQPRFAFEIERTQAKLFMSKTLRDGQIRDFYSELVALDV
jgi:hypothetical protein